MYCSKCGTAIPSGSRYCPGCDAYVGPESTPAADTFHRPVCKIGFQDAVRNFFTQYVDFSGRATRSEYWYVILFHILVSVVIGIANLLLPEVAAVLNGVYSLVTLIPGFAIVWRRLHDVGRSGGWYFILLVPFVGWIILLVFLCKDSDGDNRFGPRKV